ncbi:Calcium-dependent lipid-binding domain-containing protein [Quillaja saponaria]|uniref:Calcium-dependent lipid-binding domain-containing protein n=1 Tax=Quillaja saponaria TaxID=32244 RepID=A0AAD7LNH3_QUISA|nr:Calcium-dependent lipid-binding domain-containing protein [Quillaja saponaria]KAJ7960557.1 Calcium-dependent lipid-binding domain-containing protein [Quillaja saponaria]
MDSFNQSHQTTGCRYNPDPNHADGDDKFSGILEIYVHHASNIHNICIYEKQDVYAKFSLTYNPDETLSTSIIHGGGKNPRFNESLRMKITQIDAVLKCEIWMLSRVRNYLEDQLLGFALVPISQFVGKGRVTQDYSLSSTDLFHSPAGTVKLTLSLDTSFPIGSSANSSSISSEVVLLDSKTSEVMLDPVEYSRIEFPEISVVRENQQMVSEYFSLAAHSSALRPNSGGLVPFLCLGASPQLVDDYEMTVNSHKEISGASTSPNGSIQTSGFLSSTTTSLSDERNSADSTEKKNHLGDTPTSKKEIEARDDKDSNFSNKEKENNKERNMHAAKFGRVISAPLGNLNIEAEQSAMQQQIVDMYMRSMQQFTESLAKMKLPMDLDKPEREDCGDVIQNHNNNKIEVDEKKKDGSRVFYGSRAFF